MRPAEVVKNWAQQREKWTLNSPSKKLKLINKPKRGLVLKWWPIPRNVHTPQNRMIQNDWCYFYFIQ